MQEHLGQRDEGRKEVGRVEAPPYKKNAIFEEYVWI